MVRETDMTYSYIARYEVYDSPFECRFEKEKDLLSSQLSSLKRIWSQPQWQACLKHLCCHGEFRSAVLKIIKIFEEELSKCREETNMLHQPDQISHSTLMSLVSLIIPPLLKVNII